MTVLRVDTIAGTGTTFGPLLDGNLEFNSQNYIVLPKGSSNQQGVLRTTEDVIGVGGTYYDNLVLAMPFNEATGLRDVSSRNRNPGAYGNVAISTAQSKYYGSSAYFDGTGDYLSIDVGISTATSDFVLGPSGSNFTIEFYLYATSSANSSIISTYSNWNDAANGYLNRWALVFQTNKIKWFNSTGNSIIEESAALLNQWVHYAICRNGSTITMYRNGTSIGSQTANQDYTLTNPLLIGYIPGWGYYQGYLQDLRIYKGIAKYTTNFTPPERIAEIGVGFKTGALRYNTDSNKPELYDGNQWTELQISNVGLGTAGDTGPGARGVFGGGRGPGDTSIIDYINISSTGNAQEFGNLSRVMGAGGAVSNSNRGLFGGGTDGVTGGVNTIDYISFSSTGNSQDYGDLTVGREGLSSCASSTRGLFISGIAPTATNIVDYVTTASIGNAQDFGDLLNVNYESSACASSTRGVIGGGLVGGGVINTISFVTISTLGNAQDFGDLTTSHRGPASCSNTTRGLFSGGYGPASQLLTTTSYITISTLGNSVNFGERTIGKRLSVAVSSSTRGAIAGGYPDTNVIDYFTISTQSNAVDFGDLTTARHFGNSACSNAHGGL